MAEQGIKLQPGNKRIVKNTFMLYMRQVLIMLVGLYTVRVVLKTLGIEDYGVYNVVSGAVTMFSFLTGAMAVGSQRFFSFYIGKNDYQHLKKVFHNTLTIYIFLSSVIILLGESLGYWFINNKLVIPEDRLFAANCIFQISILSFVFSMMSAPFIAIIMSHEDMNIFARIGIIEVFFKLAIVFVLILSPFDKLITYGLLLFMISVIIFLLYFLYCTRKYKECTFKLEYNKPIINEIAGFSSWNLFGNFAWIIKNQGTSFMLNIFFGPAINAAQNLAIQIRSVVNTFASNFMSAVQPQIVKSYAKNEYEKMFMLMSSASKMSFILMAIISIPVILNLDFFLNIWLVKVPDYATAFTKILLVEASLEAMSTPTASVNQATGRIKYYQMIIGILGLLNLPVSYCFLRLGYDPDSVYVISLLLQIAIILHRALYLRNIQKDISFYTIKNVFAPCVLAGVISFVICYYLHCNSSNVIYTVLTCCYEVIIVLCFGYFIILNKQEKKYACKLINDFIKKIRNENQQS